MPVESLCSWARTLSNAEFVAHHDEGLRTGGAAANRHGGEPSGTVVVGGEGRRETSGRRGFQ